MTERAKLCIPDDRRLRQDLTSTRIHTGHDFVWRDDFSSPRQRLSVRSPLAHEALAVRDDVKTLKSRILSFGGGGCNNVRSGGQFAAVGDHRTPMRSPNELGTRATRAAESFQDAGMTHFDAESKPDSGGVYSEEVFQYFLEIERRRSRVSGQSFFLLVISSAKAPGEAIPQPLADKAFAALSASVRETDFVGWHLHGKMIGAVLFQAIDPSKIDAAGRVNSRLSKALARQLPSVMVGLLRFRLCEICGDREVWI